MFPCAAWETTRITTTTITGLATSAGTPYSTTGVSNDAVRIIGYCDFASGLATVGSWASSCTTLQLFGPGVKKPGDVVQTVSGTTTSVGTTTSATFAALSSGQTVALTPTAAMNLVRVASQGTIGGSANIQAGLQISHTISAVTTLIGNPTSSYVTSSSNPAVTSILLLDAPGVTSAVTYGFQGKTGSGTMDYPFTSTGSFLEATEIMGALDAPANDNSNPGIFAMTG